MSEPVDKKSKAHSTFRNQPSFDTFSNNFESPTDALYLGLYEIHPHFLREEQQPLYEKNENVVLVDPRTGLPPEDDVIDFTKRNEPVIFYSPFKSLLTKREHAGGLGFLLAKQVKGVCSEDDELIYRGTADKRGKEKLKFLKYAEEFTETEHERIYAHAAILKKLYRTWYQRKAQILTDCLPDLSYKTFTSFPKVSSMAWRGRVVLDEVSILSCDGEVAVWENYSDIIDAMKLEAKLEKYSEMYVDAMLDVEQEQELEQEHIGSLNREGIAESHDEGCKYDLGVEALLFLLTAGDYPDIPTEMLVDVGTEFIKFHDPLPARNVGWHTQAQIVQQAFDAFQTTSQCIRWVNLQTAESPPPTPRPPPTPPAPPPVDESAPSGSKQKQTELDYKPQLLSEYFANNPDSMEDPKIALKSNSCHVVWHLRDTASSEVVQIHTKLAQPAAVDPGGTNLGTIMSLKLEHKPQFGCEVMTKYELLKEWLTLRLLAAQKQLLHRLRLSASTFVLLAAEQITIEEIEKQLLKTYKLRVSQMLSGLLDFLNMFKNVAKGHYMLRYSKMFSNQLLLCAVAEEGAERVINLHTILREKPCDWDFMIESTFLPIADDVCSAVHRHHRVLPCAFPPARDEKPAPVEKPATAVNARRDRPPALGLESDRDFTLKKLQKKKAAAKENEILRQKRKRARRRAREAAEKQTKLQEQQEDESQQEEELDEAAHGFA